MFPHGAASPDMTWSWRLTPDTSFRKEEIDMSDSKKLVIVNSRGFDDERSSVAWSIANTAVASGMDVTVFLVAAGADWVRKGAAQVAQLNPLDPPMNAMIGNFLESGGRILVCPPCAKVRGYTQESLIDGAILAGAPSMLEEIAAGAASLSF
jgi:predicted peroxiredoxin